MKIVLDTNLLIDGSSDDNNFGNRIIDEVIAGKLQAFANRSTLRENHLLSGQKISDPQYLEKLNLYFEAVRAVENGNRLDVVEDHEDNKILESAVNSESEYLITSDHHLLKIGTYEHVKIVTPGQFWHEYEEESSTGWKNWLESFIK